MECMVAAKSCHKVLLRDVHNLGFALVQMNTCAVRSSCT